MATRQRVELAAAALVAIALVGCETPDEMSGMQVAHTSTPGPSGGPGAAPRMSLPEGIEPAPAFHKDGFRTFLADGRLWVFEEDDQHLAKFKSQGELAKHVIRPGAGPAGLTVKAPDTETALAYLTAKPGFHTVIDDGRLWAFRQGSEAWQAFQQTGEPAKRVIRPAGGPMGMTVMAPDTDVIQDYLTAKPGFHTVIDDGRLWVFRQGDRHLAKFKSRGELAKHVIRPGAGPNGMTLKAPDTETIYAYVAAAEGFETFIEDGRIWVFRKGDPALAHFQQQGEPAKHVIRPGAGPLGLTVKAPDTETLDAYLRAVSS